MSIIVDMNLFMQSRIVGTNLFVRINPFVHMVKHRQVCAYRLKKRRRSKSIIVGTNLFVHTNLFMHIKPFVHMAKHRQVCAYKNICSKK